jgi:hypothetical protein
VYPVLCHSLLCSVQFCTGERKQHDICFWIFSYLHLSQKVDFSCTYHTRGKFHVYKFLTQFNWENLIIAQFWVPSHRTKVLFNICLHSLPAESGLINVKWLSVRQFTPLHQHISFMESKEVWIWNWNKNGNRCISFKCLFSIRLYKLTTNWISSYFWVINVLQPV